MFKANWPAARGVRAQAPCSNSTILNGYNEPHAHRVRSSCRRIGYNATDGPAQQAQPGSKVRCRGQAAPGQRLRRHPRGGSAERGRARLPALPRTARVQDRAAAAAREGRAGTRARAQHRPGLRGHGGGGRGPGRGTERDHRGGLRGPRQVPEGRAPASGAPGAPHPRRGRGRTQHHARLPTAPLGPGEPRPLPGGADGDRRGHHDARRARARGGRVGGGGRRVRAARRRRDEAQALGGGAEGGSGAHRRGRRGRRSRLRVLAVRRRVHGDAAAGA